MKDWHLVVAVFILVVIDLVMTGLYLLLTGLRDQLETDLTPNRENPVDIIGVRILCCTRLCVTIIYYIKSNQKC